MSVPGGYSSVKEAVQDAAELCVYVASDDLESAGVKVIEVAEKVTAELVESTKECMKNPNWDPDPGC
jgi:hypothetical protein